MKCEHIDTGGGYYQLPCDREATRKVTFTVREGGVGVKHVCRYHAPFRLAKLQPSYCTIEKIKTTAE